MEHEPRARAPRAAPDGLRALLDLLPGLAVVVTDPAGLVRVWSPGAERLTGREARACVGEPPPWPESLSHAELERADGASVRVHVTSRALASGGVVHLLGEVAGATVAAPWSIDPGKPEEVVDFHGILTCDPAMREVIQLVRNVAEVDVTVLVRGESGTGKELVARALHDESPRRRGPFVAVNCASFTPSLLESELFGHAKGAFTGAVAARKGIFAQADGGTLFLDEVAELPLDLQAKLLRVLQERVFVPVGGTEPQAVDVRVVAATHRALREEVRAGRFREDLMFRLRVVPVFIPPLRQRSRDIELLLRHFVAELNRRGARAVEGFTPDALRALLAHPWTGNVREMRNVVEYAFAVGRGTTIGMDALPPEFREAVAVASVAGPPLTARARAVAERAEEAARVRAALAQTGGDIEQAASLLGVSRTTFWRMRRRAGV